MASGRPEVVASAAPQADVDQLGTWLARLRPWSRSISGPTADRPRTAGVDMLRLVIIAASFVVLSWVVMIVLARRLPPGLAKDLATVLPACVTTARRLRRDSRVPKRVKVAVAFAGLWVLSPIDLIPEFLPVIGPLDDIVVVALALRFAARRIPPEALIDAWPAEPESWTGLCRSRGPPPRPTERIDGCNHCEAQSRGPHPGSYWRAARVRGRSTGSALAATSDAGGVLAGVSMKVRRDPD